MPADMSIPAFTTKVEKKAKWFSSLYDGTSRCAALLKCLRHARLRRDVKIDSASW